MSVTVYNFISTHQSLETIKLAQHLNTVDEMAVGKTTVDKMTFFQVSLLCVIMRQYKWRYAKIPIIVWPKNT